MIVSFRHKGLKQLFERGNRRGVNPQHVEKIENILGVLDIAQKIEDVDMHSFKLHPLSGDLRGFWSETVRRTGASSSVSRTGTCSRSIRWITIRRPTCP